MSREGEEEEDVARLLQELEREKARSTSLLKEVERVKARTVEVSVEAEAEEECMTNKLTKRLLQLKKEKEILANAVEQEEELLTNNLQRQLTQLKQEKVSLESQLEAEHEAVVNRLRKHLHQVESEKEVLQSALDNRVADLGGIEKGGSEAVARLKAATELIKIELSGAKCASLAQELTDSVDDVAFILASTSQKIEKLAKEAAELKRENASLRDEGFLLKRRVEAELETREKAESEKLSLQSAVEADDERMFNSMSRMELDGGRSPSSSAASLSSVPNSSQAQPQTQHGGVRRVSLVEIMQDVRNEAMSTSSAMLDEDGCPMQAGRSPNFPPKNRASPATSVGSAASAGYNPMRRRSTITTPTTSPGAHPARATGEALAALSLAAPPPFSLSSSGGGHRHHHSPRGSLNSNNSGALGA